MDFKDSKTFQNLQTAYKAELMSSTKYEIYNDIAVQYGYVEIGSIYEATARNNKEHARIWLRQINEGKLPDLTQALQDSITEETNNANTMYQEFAQIARDEGFTDIASLFSGVANIDYNHATNFQILLTNVQNNTFFCKTTPSLWVCIQCGNIMSAECAPDICPVCKFPRGFYKLLNESLYI